MPRLNNKEIHELRKRFDAWKISVGEWAIESPSNVMTARFLLELHDLNHKLFEELFARIADLEEHV